MPSGSPGRPARSSTTPSVVTQLTAATARRDSVTAQLSNVRPMLATLGVASMVDSLVDEPQPRAGGQEGAADEKAPQGKAEQDAKADPQQDAKADPQQDAKADPQQEKTGQQKDAPKQQGGNQPRRA
jgi:hypothetical protein